MQQITITITVTPAQAALMHAGAAALGLSLPEALLRPIPEDQAPTANTTTTAAVSITAEVTN